MEFRPANTHAALPLFLTRDELYQMMVIVVNPAVDLGEHEMAICSKLREAWDALGPGGPHWEPEGAA
jgi:hypothetical protein